METKLDSSNPEHMTYAHSEIQITVLGGIRLEGLDRMRTTLKIQVEHLSIRHSLDLYNDTQVEKLVRRVAEKLEVGTSIITPPVGARLQRVILSHGCNLPSRQ